MAKVMVAVEEKTYVAPAKLSVREYLTKEWLPAIKSTVRPTTYAPTTARHLPYRAAHRLAAPGEGLRGDPERALRQARQ